MAHRGKGGDKTKPQKTAKHARHFEVCKENTKRRLAKWKRRRKFWASDPDYQLKQKIRREKLERLKQEKKSD